MSQPLAWHTEKRKIRELVPTKQNPRKLSPQERERLEAKLNKLGIFEIPTIETNGALLNFNQRLKILLALGKGEEEIDVRVPNRELTEEERKEIILSSNIHEGEWDMAILEDAFADIDLMAVGLDDELVAQLQKTAEEEDAKMEQEPEYPIVARFSEKYDALVIVSDNEIDTNYLREILGMGMEHCYKASHIGTTNVISAKKFIEAWKSRS